METQEGYNTWAATYDTMLNKTRDLEASVLRTVLNGYRFTKVIELGCGTGKNTGWLAGISQQVTAVDFSEEMIRMAIAKSTHNNVRFLQADITKTWSWQQADLITASLILEHITELDEIFQKASAALLPGGMFYICELHPYKQLQGSRARFECGDTIIALHYYIHHISDFFQAAKKAGFICTDMQEWFDPDEKKVPRLCSFVFKLKES